MIRSVEVLLLKSRSTTKQDLHLQEVITSPVGLIYTPQGGSRLGHLEIPRGSGGECRSGSILDGIIDAEKSPHRGETAFRWESYVRRSDDTCRAISGRSTGIAVFFSVTLRDPPSETPSPGFTLTIPPPASTCCRETEATRGRVLALRACGPHQDPLHPLPPDSLSGASEGMAPSETLRSPRIHQQRSDVF